jgi:hypothetical protein
MNLADRICEISKQFYLLEDVPSVLLFCLMEFPLNQCLMQALLS